MALLTHLAQLRETRSHINQSYPLIEVAFLVIVALLCRQRTWSDIEDFGDAALDWLRQYLPYENGIPTRHNIARIIRTIEPESLLEVLVAWVNEYRASQGRSILAIDGKEVRGVERSGRSAPLNMVSAYDVEEHLVVYHHACEGKGQELVTVQQMVEAMSINQCIISLDALHCHAETLKLIKRKRADAVVQVKKNQPQLFAAVDEAFQAYWQRPDAGQASVSSTDKGHGRQDTRTVYCIKSGLDKELKLKWPMIKSFIAVVRERHKGSTCAHSTAYYACTDVLDLETCQRVTRQHWHTENNQHWSLDVAFREDEQTIHHNKAAKNLASLRRFVLNLLRKDTLNKSLPRKMNRAFLNAEYRHKVLFTES